MTDGQIFHPHHTDVQLLVFAYIFTLIYMTHSNFSAFTPASSHLCSWRSSPNLFSLITFSSFPRTGTLTHPNTAQRAATKSIQCDRSGTLLMVCRLQDQKNLITRNQQNAVLDWGFFCCGSSKKLSQTLWSCWCLHSSPWFKVWNVLSVWYFTYPTFPIPLVGEGAGETGMKSILLGEEDFSDLSKSLSLCKYKVSDLTLTEDITSEPKAQPSNGKTLGQMHTIGKTDELKLF